MDYGPDRAVIYQFIMPQTITNAMPNWHGIGPKSVLNPFQVAGCTLNTVSGAMQAVTPDFLKKLIPNFGKGLADTCNIDKNTPVNYEELLKKIGGAIGITEAIKKGVVVGGYS